MCTYSYIVPIGTLFLDGRGDYVKLMDLRVGSLFTLTHIFTDLGEICVILKPLSNDPTPPKSGGGKRKRRKRKAILRKNRREISNQIQSGIKRIHDADLAGDKKRTKTKCNEDKKEKTETQTPS
jgi:hypothetical protein